MMRGFVVVLVALWCGVASAQLAVVQTTGVAYSSNAAQVTLTFSSAVSSGDALVLCIASYRSVSETLSVADTVGNVNWFRAGAGGPEPGSAYVSEVWVCPLSAAGPCTVTVSGSGYINVVGLEVSGVGTGLVLCGAGGSTGSSASAVSASWGTTVANALLVESVCFGAGSSGGPPSGWTELGALAFSNNVHVGSDAHYLLASATRNGVSESVSVGSGSWCVASVGLAAGVASSGGSSSPGFWDVRGPEVVAWYFLWLGFQYGFWFIRSKQRLR